MRLPGILLSVTFVVLTGALARGGTTGAATVTVAYAVGHRDVVVNGYGTRALGTFVLRPAPADGAGDHERLALCIEADTTHSTTADRYRRVPNRLTSPELDYLLWRYGGPGAAVLGPLGDDHDTATALAALAWYHAGATRRGGGAVWADPAAGFAAVTPESPHRWDALPRWSPSSPVGLWSGGRHLDAAERRVLELHREATARRGPWTLAPLRRAGDRIVTHVSGPGGPIRDVGGVRIEVRDHTGVVRTRATAATDHRGTVSARIGPLPDGGRVTVTMSSPGVHQEWDGDGAVQRMVTGTERRLTQTIQVPPADRYVEVTKTTTDPAFGVDGARLDLVDAGGTTIASATTDRSGTARFGPVDPTGHPTPWTVRERRAPDGLAPAPAPVEVPVPLSTDADRPTMVRISNEPVAYPLRIAKELSDPRVGPPDRSGFGFEVTRSDGRSFGTATTGSDGRTPVVTVTRGRFRVCERTRPPWAAELTDPGCTEVAFGPGADPERTVTVAYTNVVPEPRLSSRVRVPDRSVAVLPAAGGPLVDEVRYEGLVPGTRYELRGAVVDVSGGEPRRTAVTAATTFVPDSPAGTVSVTFDVRPDRFAAARPVVGVVVQTLLVDGDPVAEHADPDDAAQTFRWPAITTRATLDVRAPDDHAGPVYDLVDTATVRGLPAGEHRAEVHWHVRTGDGECHPTGLVATVPVELAATPLPGDAVEIVVGPVEAPAELAGATLVAHHTVTDAEATVLAAHTDCDDPTQTVTVPVPPTTTSTTTTTTTTSPPTTTTTAPPEPAGPTTAAPATSTSSTSSTTSTTTTTTVAIAGPRPTLPRTGAGGIELQGAIALLALGGGGLLGVTAATARRRP